MRRSYMTVAERMRLNGQVREWLVVLFDRKS